MAITFLLEEDPTTEAILYLCFESFLFFTEVKRIKKISKTKK